MKNIYGNDGPVIMAEDGKFEVIGHKGNELLYKGGSIKVTGNIGSTIVGKEEGDEPGPGPEPLLPIAPMTLRFAFSRESTDPSTLSMEKGSWSKVENDPGYANVWDWTYDNAEWNDAFWFKFNSEFDPDVKVIDAGDTKNVKDVTGMFYQCPSLTNVCVFDTRNVTNMYQMFQNCTSLTTVPLFKTNSVTNVSKMFSECVNLESGMLDFYNKASATGKVTDKSECFTNAGTNTESGRAERAQIPRTWGGDVKVN